jgi:hydroxymethylbilane synthase
MTTSARLRIGTRASPLARAQTELVRAALAAAHPELAAPEAIEVVAIRTTGDARRDARLADIGGKGLFTKEIEEALAAGTIDLAVHSMKDMPTELPPGLAIPALLERADPRDALIGADSIADLRRGAVIGTSSLRRAAQMKYARPDFEIVPLRGNVGTRLGKVAAGEIDATLLAQAGLDRLDMADAADAVLAPDELLPAVAQGAVGVECREGDSRTRDWLAAIDHGETATVIACERALLAALDGSCRTPIGGLAELAGEEISLRALIVTPDGATLHETTRRGPARDAAALGADAGAELKSRGGPEFFVE